MFGMFVKLLDKWEFIKSPNSDLPSHFHNTITKIDTLNFNPDLQVVGKYHTILHEFIPTQRRFAILKIRISTD